jgi:NADPH:quinone reductase-like Zn-dependent oxidoreductase
MRLRSLDVPRGLTTILRLVMGWNGPRQPILGTELCGTVVALGPKTTRFAVGDEVVANCSMAMGCHAELRTVKESSPIIRRPKGLTDEQAGALAFGGTTALHFLRDRGGIQAGMRVLVVGASGAVGSAGVQIARHFGAQVTTVTSSANLELARQLGASETLDYSMHNVLTMDARYDLILDTVNTLPWADARRILTKNGRLLMVAAEVPQMLTALSTIGRRQQAMSSVVPDRLADLEWLGQAAENGAYIPVIDSVFPLDQIVQAYQRVETGRKRGSVVLRIT